MNRVADVCLSVSKTREFAEATRNQTSKARTVELVKFRKVAKELRTIYLLIPYTLCVHIKYIMGKR